ncbi:tetratricopeptide repeat protein [Jiella sonneratiae]|uniref:Tetratricopeptide repeat protein n=1 Tax=Jiella sonneratiae TaxID=2816856 RepID=A0ABS3J1I3_9HYPH|nr:tetratricopeptide repeat protein [Jiella sonneratiae]MBO0903542.1 tetratricopeptide repeat protein [Jiella sonneratiae]
MMASCLQLSGRILAGFAAACLAFAAAAAALVPDASAQTTGEPRGLPQPHAADDLPRLFARLRAARDEASARAIEDRIWRRWMEAPDEKTGALLREAMARREVYDFAGARTLLDAAVAGAPDYAEAWNQRGFVRFLQEDFDGALEDVDRAIAIEPRHFAAMAGRALILMRQGRHRLAQDQLRAAVAIDPFLKERSLLVAPTGGPAPAKGQVDL